MRPSNHVVVGLALLGIGCSGRPAGDDQTATAGDETATTAVATTSGTDTTNAASDGDGATGTLEPCDEHLGFTLCGTECVVLHEDEWNCGECGHACPLAEYAPGSCVSGECAPTGTSPCVHPDDGIPNCEALCNTIGQHCGGNGHSMYFSNVEDADCGYKTSSVTEYDASCDAPFEWDRLGGGGIPPVDPAVGAHCICTNEE